MKQLTNRMRYKLTAIGIDVSIRNELLASARNHMQTRVQRVTQERNTQFNLASTKHYNDNDIAQLRAENQNITVHDGYVFNTNSDGTETPIGMYYAQSTNPVDENLPTDENPDII